MAGNPHRRGQEPPGAAHDGGHRLSYAPSHTGRHRGGDAGWSGAWRMAKDRRQLPGFARKISMNKIFAGLFAGLALSATAQAQNAMPVMELSAGFHRIEAEVAATDQN